MRRALRSWCAVGAGLGCAPSPEPPAVLDVIVEVVGDPRRVIVRDGDAELGHPDADGRIRKVGVTVGPHALSPACPKGQRGAEVVVAARAAATTRATLRCEPATRVGIVAVRAAGFAGLPVSLDGREVARTDEAGHALVRVEREGEATFEVVVDGTGRSLQPPRVSRSFRLEGRDELFLFVSELREQRVRRVVSREKPLPAVRGPYELR